MPQTALHTERMGTSVPAFLRKDPQLYRTVPLSLSSKWGSASEVLAGGVLVGYKVDEAAYFYWAPVRLPHLTISHLLINIDYVDIRPDSDEQVVAYFGVKWLSKEGKIVSLFTTVDKLPRDGHVLSLELPIQADGTSVGEDKIVDINETFCCNTWVHVLLGHGGVLLRSCWLTALCAD